MSSPNTGAPCPSLWRPQSPIVSRCFRPRSRSRRRHNKLTTIPIILSPKTSSEPKLETVIDLNYLTAQASSTFRTLFPSLESNLIDFISSGKEAYRDLQTLVTIDDNRRVVVSCRPSTLHFIGTSAVLSFISITIFRVLIKLFSGFWLWGRNASRYSPTVRRDRSLGGKEVIVGWNNNANYNPRILANPLSPPQGSVTGTSRRATRNRNRVEGKLPKWWPTLVTRAVSTENEEYKRDAYRVVQGLTFLSEIFNISPMRFLVLFSPMAFPKTSIKD